MDAELSEQVQASFAGAKDPRFAEVMRSLVRHLHAFLDDVALTEAEWAAAIDFLTRTGQKCDARRQEFILLSDVLGASMAVININHPRHLNHPAGAAPTESTVLGPFFVEDAPEFGYGADISGGAAGRRCRVSGTVRAPDGTGIPGALLDVWQSDEHGRYDVQYPDLEGPQARGRLRTDEQGRYAFASVLPEAYPIPHDGPVGELLSAASRGPMRPAHVHFKITAPGYRTLVTHLFAAGDRYLGSDAVFGVKDSLVVDFARDGEPAATYDFTLEPAG